MGEKTIADRPIRFGLPVPYVANWTAEHWEREIEDDNLHGVMVGDVVGMIAYDNELDADRDDHGCLWMRSALSNGGEPEFGQVNAPRHRRCVMRCLCQVCSAPVDRERTPWIVPGNEWDKERVEGKFLTTNPPVCHNCMPFALRLCPHLRGRGAHPLIVTKWARWGVLGDVYGRTGKTLEVKPQVMLVPFGNNDVINRTLAKQYLIELIDYEEIDPSEVLNVGNSSA